MKLSNGMNRTLLGDTPYPECVYMHWGLQIGPYLYELLTDEGFNGHLMNRRLVQDQPEFWESAVQDQVVGYTALTDREINSAGESHSEPHHFRINRMITISSPRCPRPYGLGRAGLRQKRPLPLLEK